MEWFETIKLFFEWGNYQESQVRRYVELKKITEDECKAILLNKNRPKQY
jgi:uncharacterized XkdX family phage protein